MQLEEISYKDPASFIQKVDNSYVRIITEKYQFEYEHLMSSGLYEALLKKNLILQHEEINDKGHALNNKPIHKLIKPFQLSFISYPYEWCFEQWKQAILCLLEINLTAIEFGMILKDATPYNFAFVNTDCLLIDTGSFTFYKDGDPWIAYREFCEAFLAPIALMKYNDPVWGRLYKNALTGLPLDFVSKELSFRSFFNSSCLLHIHLHAFFSKSKGNGKQPVANYFSKKKISALFLNLKNSIAHWGIKNKPQEQWLQYYDKDVADNYSTRKENFIKNWLKALNHNATIIDVGANTGKYAQLASNYCDQVYAVEADMLCCNSIFNLHNKKIIPILADLVEPSPDLGWMNREKKALLKRLNGDTVLMLAVIHHLAIGKNIPLQFIAKLAHQITNYNLVIEFISKEDDKVKAMLLNREDIFDTYDESSFITALSKYFSIRRSEIVTPTRKLFLCEKK